MSITTTITWTDLTNQYQDQLSDLEDAHTELKEQIQSEFGDDALTRQVPEPEKVADVFTDGEETEIKRLSIYKQLASQYESAKTNIDSTLELLDKLKGEYGSGDFEVKMLTSQEVVDLESELRMDAKGDVDGQVLKMQRNLRTVDAAIIDAPEGVPRDDDGSPVPSECPEGLVDALYDQVQKYNSAGDTGFTSSGFQSGVDVA